MCSSFGGIDFLFGGMRDGEGAFGPELGGGEPTSALIEGTAGGRGGETLAGLGACGALLTGGGTALAGGRDTGAGGGFDAPAFAERSAVAFASSSARSS